MQHTITRLTIRLLLVQKWKWFGPKFHVIFIAFIAMNSNLAVADSRGVKQISQAEFDQHLIRLEVRGLTIIEAKQVYIKYQLDREAVDRALNKATSWNVDNQDSTYHAENRDLTLNSNFVSDNAYAQWDAIIRDLEDRYFAGLQALAPGKDNIIASMARARMRISMLDEEHISRAWLFGAHLDLIAELQGFAVENEAVQEVLLEYEYAMQSELEKLIEIFIEKNGSPAIESMKQTVEQFGIEEAKEEIESLVMRRSQRGLAISRLRSLNEQTVIKLLAILPVEDAKRFRNKIYPQLYPFLYKDPKPIIFVNRLLVLKDLTDNQRSGLLSIRDDFMIRRDQKLSSLATIYGKSIGEKSLMVRHRSSIMYRANRDTSFPKVSSETLAFESALEKWRVVESQYRSKMLGILTTKQKERVQ